MTRTFRNVVSLNFELSAAYGSRFEFGFGSPRLGGRVLPLLLVHLSRTWSVGFDGRLHFAPETPRTSASNIQILGVGTATW